MIYSVTLMKYQKYFSKLIRLVILGADNTSFTYGEVHNGYPFGHNAIIFLPFSTYIAVIISRCTKIVIDLVASGVPTPPSKLGKKNPV